MKRWKVTLNYHGSAPFACTENAVSQELAIASASRYAYACGWPANYASATVKPLPMQEVACHA